jgi:imidazolonepropionase-like amidohydrolase
MLRHSRLAAFLFAVLVFVGQSEAQGPLAIEHVTVIDATGRPAMRNMTVIVKNGRIASVGAATNAAIPKGARVLSGEGRYLIPGLWDAHVHALWDADRPAQFFPLFLANGVTNVREMGGPMPAADQVVWRQRVASGQVDGPDLIVPGPFVDGPHPVWPGSMTVADAAEASNAVHMLQHAGVDFIKVYSQVPREAYFALAEESRKNHIPFAGHVPLMIDVGEASDAGQTGIEHLMGILLATSARGEELKNRLLAGANINELNDALVESYDPARASALFSRFVRNGTWQVPTLTIRHARPFLAELAAANDPRLLYMPKAITAGWISRDDPRQPGTVAIVESRKRLYRKELEILGAMNRAGVRIAAGTDTPNPFCFPGFSLHDELALLVEAGLSPMEALQAGTRNAALMTGRDAEFGTIEKGKEANLVLLDADPLKDIRNTRKIDTVILHGRVLARTELDAMLGRAAYMK